jgi:hypothetical protein
MMVVVAAVMAGPMAGRRRAPNRLHDDRCGADAVVMAMVTPAVSMVVAVRDHTAASGRDPEQEGHSQQALCSSHRGTSRRV